MVQKNVCIFWEQPHGRIKFILFNHKIKWNSFVYASAHNIEKKNQSSSIVIQHLHNITAYTIVLFSLFFSRRQLRRSRTLKIKIVNPSQIWHKTNFGKRRKQQANRSIRRTECQLMTFFLILDIDIARSPYTVCVCLVYDLAAVGFVWHYCFYVCHVVVAQK